MFGNKYNCIYIVCSWKKCTPIKTSKHTAREMPNGTLNPVLSHGGGGDWG